MEDAKAKSTSDIDDVVEIDVEAAAQPEPVRNTAPDDDDVMPFASSYGETNSRSPLPMIGGGIAVLAIIAVAVWIFVPMGNSGNAQTTPVQSAVQNEPASTTARPEVPAATAPTETTSMPAAVPNAEPSPAADAAVPDQSASADRPAVPAATQAKTKKPTAEPAPSKAPAEKKKAVTVDDLINDN